MKAGAIDFLEKPFREDRFLEVVRFALVCDEKSVRKNQELLRTQARLQSLSQRERQVLDGLVAGKANKMIAHELNISIRTVEIHRSNVMAKMEAKSLSELIRMALFLEVASGSHERVDAPRLARPSMQTSIDCGVSRTARLQCHLGIDIKPHRKSEKLDNLMPEVRRILPVSVEQDGRPVVRSLRREPHRLERQSLVDAPFSTSRI